MGGVRGTARQRQYAPRGDHQRTVDAHDEANRARADAWTPPRASRRTSVGRSARAARRSERHRDGASGSPDPARAHSVRTRPSRIERATTTRRSIVARDSQRVSRVQTRRTTRVSFLAALKALPRHPPISLTQFAPIVVPTHPQDAPSRAVRGADRRVAPGPAYFDRDEVNIKWDQRLGEGGFCTAYRATWRGARMTRTTSETSAFPLPIRASRRKSGSSPHPASALTPLDRSHAQAARCARASSIPAVCPAPSPRWPLSKVRSRPRPRRRHPALSPSNLPRTSQLSREIERFKKVS